MKEIFAEVIRAAIAVQMATLELHDESLSATMAGPALDFCVKELVAAVKRLRKQIT